MARTVTDTALMLDALSGSDPSDPHSLGVARTQTLATIVDVNSEALRGLRVGWRPLAGNTMLDDEVRHACEEALDAFRALGCQVDVQDTPIENAEPAWRVLQQSNWAAEILRSN